MRILLTVLAFFLFTSVSAQDASPFVGEWLFQEVGSKADMSAEEMEMMNEFFKNTAFSFSSDGTCTVMMMGRKDVGNYSIKNDGKLIEMSSKSGKTEQFKVLELTDDLLTIEMGGSNGSMVLRRKGSESAPVAEFPLQKASVESLSKTWWMQEMTTAVDGKVSRTVSEKEQTPQYRALKEIMPDLSIDIKADGKYVSGSPYGVQEGTWAFGDSKDTIVVTVNGQTAIWKIYEISDGELVMFQENTQDFYFFGLKPAAK